MELETRIMTSLGKHWKRSADANKKVSIKLKGRIPWNKDLTSNDVRIAKQANTYKNNYKNGKIKVSKGQFKKGHKTNIGRKRVFSIKHKLNMSSGMKGRIPWNKNKKFVHSGSFKIGHELFVPTKYYSKRAVYNGIVFRSSLEAKFAKFLDNNKIKFEYEKRKIKYIKNNKEHYYWPDFYLLDFDTFIEIKGYFRKNDVEKIELVKSQNNIKLLIIKQNEFNKVLKI